jgi:signal peptidase II
VTGTDDEGVVPTDTHDSMPAVRRPSSLPIVLAVAVAVVALDQLTKHWALEALSDGRARHVIWTLQWNLTFNSGMAFSRGQGIGPIIGAVALVVIVAMVLSLRRASSRLATVAVGLVVGGAIGNLGDRLFRDKGWLRGSVVDFIDLQWFPIFNIADMGVTIGGVLLLIAALFESKPVPAS